MNTEDLKLANEIQKEIKELDLFIFMAERVWTGKLLQKTPKTSSITFKSNAYGAINSSEYEMNTEVKNKVLDVLREHLQSLKDKLENM